MRSSAASVSDRGLSSSITRTLTPVPRNDAATSSRPATPRSSSARTGLRARTHVRISRTASRLVRSATATSSQAAAGSESRTRPANSRLIPIRVSRCPSPSCSSCAARARSWASMSSFSSTALRRSFSRAASRSAIARRWAARATSYPDRTTPRAVPTDMRAMKERTSGRVCAHDRPRARDSTGRADTNTSPTRLARAPISTTSSAAATTRTGTEKPIVPSCAGPATRSSTTTEQAARPRPAPSRRRTTHKAPTTPTTARTQHRTATPTPVSAEASRSRSPKIARHTSARICRTGRRAAPVGKISPDRSGRPPVCCCWMLIRSP